MTTKKTKLEPMLGLDSLRRAMEAVESKRLKREPMIGLDSFPPPRKGKKGTTNWLKEEWKPLGEILKKVEGINVDDIELWVRKGLLPVLHSNESDDDRPSSGDEYPLDVVEILAEEKRLSELASKPKPKTNWESMESILRMVSGVTASDINDWTLQGKIAMIDDKYPLGRVKELLEEKKEFEKIAHSH